MSGLPSGHFVTADEFLQGAVIARGRRTTSSSGATTTPVGVLRLDSVPVVAGRIYTIHLSPLIFSSTVASDLINADLRIALGATATNTTPGYTSLVEGARSGGGSQFTVGFEVDYPAATTGNLSILLTVVRAAGTGTVSLMASTSIPLSMWVKDAGLDPGNTGVAL